MTYLQRLTSTSSIILHYYYYNYVGVSVVHRRVYNIYICTMYIMYIEHTKSRQSHNIMSPICIPCTYYRYVILLLLLLLLLLSYYIIIYCVLRSCRTARERVFLNGVAKSIFRFIMLNALIA